MLATKPPDFSLKLGLRVSPWDDPMVIFLFPIPFPIPGAVPLPIPSVPIPRMGPLVLELYWQHAPRTCKNFAELSRRGYYNGTKFHRIIKDFMVQGGDPTGTGRGGASIYGKQFEDELHPDLKFTGAGILAMANAGPDTNGSQFFLTLGPAQWLDGKHSIFGRVCQGMGVLGRLAMVETNSQDRPLDDVKVIKAYPSG
ncbi:peptidyl-prolyl cis-trans isomerase-like 1 isoform X1 [Malurus melanocephalus]|uniref:peptidyl-prolyl cis-trans isomerase-like 1 isoform X1 n=1 Tax=Malurus melanocephalus TaxID=175006 RepID=UPI0025492F09|nr:peptidyl-prolyl cis-trans isomerase-like 1 isoform X1 [Malurus melanocephalus]XP_057230383.1 peptidyl-prolyl cis-trans isomerase-like 1 isoform X1 [Malurus melanocephalus]XP_057230384.1 peptidyl-prolyl cis-trans isomerase-like 1 isoform X1 [Malurus melanocephalus]